MDLVGLAAFTALSRLGVILMTEDFLVVEKVPDKLIGTANDVRRLLWAKPNLAWGQNEAKMMELGVVGWGLHGRGRWAVMVLLKA